MKQFETMELSHSDLKGIRLTPLSTEHVDALEHTCGGHGDRSIWRYLFDAQVYYHKKMEGLVDAILEAQRNGTALPFAIIDTDTDTAVGCTRLMDIERENQSLEIVTWIGPKFQGKRFNVRSKYLVLKHAFDEMSFRRVQFKIDHRNYVSIDAIENIRAVKEGILRDHVVLPLGDDKYDIRSSVVYSILDSEWPAVKLHFETKLLRLM